MSLCEMCGKEAPLVLAGIENVELNVCSSCARYGTVKKRAEPEGLRRGFGRKIIEINQPQYKVVNDYSDLVRKAREKMALTQEDFAKFLNERESIVAKWEQGHLKPGIDVARKIGRRLGINLVELEKAEKVEIKKIKSDEFTLGDFVKVRKRK